jgi:hypothetical protein
MAVEERRRIALHRAASEAWGEEVADTFMELVAPSGHELATRADIQGVLAAMATMDERLTRIGGLHLSGPRDWTAQHVVTQHRPSHKRLRLVRLDGDPRPVLLCAERR